LLFHSNLESELLISNNLSSGATTFTNWYGMNYPYPNYDIKKVKNYKLITIKEIDYLTISPAVDI
tara:strand:- start:926 stop:1120 length:195 start_codon:yes stop_codon:yes gene_type:complete